MKAIIPLAGKGTRLRPHTHLTPKPLLKVGGRPVMSYILDDLMELGVREVVFVVGYLGDVIRAYIDTEYPQIEAHYVVQEVQDGTAGAVKLAQPWADDELLILFVDTIFDADLTLVKRVPEDTAGIIWAKEVEDYQRFGVIVTRSDGTMERIVEKPKEPVSKLAKIGLYYVKDHALLFEGIDETLKRPKNAGEFYLTDAFQYMVDRAPGCSSLRWRDGTTAASPTRFSRPTSISCAPGRAGSRRAPRCPAPRSWSPFASRTASR
jgi:glucose-1-phosphate thymidylyltransferase